MSIPLSERRQIENEMIFRRANEKVIKELDKLGLQHAQEDPDLADNDDFLLHFICECSDELCDTRIPMKLSKYQKIHKNRKAFIIKNNHQVKEIETVVKKDKKHSIVEKNKLVNTSGGSLNTTTIKNN